MPKVSILLPSLNVKNYIEQCIKSVLEQTLQDIEIIIIDANSTDGTLEILRSYAEKDSRIKIIVSNVKSYGYQINKGIEVAQGDFIGIVETDDYIEKDMFESLYQMAAMYNLDYVKGYGKQFYQLENDTFYEIAIDDFFIREGFADEIINPSVKPDLLLKDRFVWLGIYRKDFIQKIKLNETPGAAFQDIGFMLQCLSTATKACYIDKMVYHYRCDNVNASGYNHKGFQFLLQENQLNKKYEAVLSDSWKQYIYYRLFQQFCGRVQAMARSLSFWDDAEEAIKALEEILESAKDKDVLSDKLLLQNEWENLQIILSGTKNLYKMYYQNLMQLYERYDAFCKKTENRENVVFGTGNLGQFVYRVLQKDKIQVNAFCDNYKSADTLFGIPVYFPNEIMNHYPDAVFIIAAGKKNRNDMYNQLLSLGVKKEQILPYDLGINTGLITRLRIK